MCIQLCVENFVKFSSKLDDIIIRQFINFDDELDFVNILGRRAAEHRPAPNRSAQPDPSEGRLIVPLWNGNDSYE